jgi:hypothetical protein
MNIKVLGGGCCKCENLLEAVKEAVAERDSFDGFPCCLLCGTPAPVNNRFAFACAHFISRSHGGLGV